MPRVYSLERIEGIEPRHARALAALSITNTEQLLESCGSQRGRARVAASSGISASLILKWTNHADLMRIKGVGGERAELLEASGIDSIRELRSRNPHQLAATMSRVNEQRRLTRAVPGPIMVSRWVDQAKNLTPRVTH